MSTVIATAAMAAARRASHPAFKPRERPPGEQPEEERDPGHVDVGVEPRGREPVGGLVEPEAAERRDQEDLDLDDDRDGQEARPPLARAARGPVLEGQQQERAEGRHRAQLGESPAGVFRERHA